MSNGHRVFILLLGVLYRHAIFVKINRRIKKSRQSPYYPQPEGLENANNQETGVTGL